MGPTCRDVAHGDVVVRVDGHLGPRSLATCRAALMADVRRPGTVLVLDLTAAQTGHRALAALALIRRYLEGRRIHLVLRGCAPELVVALRRAHVLDLYDLQPARPAPAQARPTPFSRTGS